MKKVIVISTSLRVGSNSDMLAEKFIEGARKAGHEVEKISLAGKDIRFCRGCLACQKTGKCVIDDDVNAIMQKVLNADVVVWATPIYYYEMSGQMKVLIDRMNAMYNLEYRFRDVYMLSTAAEDAPEVPERAEKGLTGWIDCYPESRLAGTLFCGGVDIPRSIEGNSKLDAAYEMGRNISNNAPQYDITMEQLAARLARELHRGQVDKAGKDYFEGHLSAVGNNGADWKEKTVGFLHDAAEDTGHTVGEIIGMLRKMVSDSSEEVCHKPSEDDWDEITEALELMNSRTASDRQAYIERFRGHGLAIRVKLTDLRHNMDLSRIPQPTLKDLARLERYRKEYAALEGMLASLESR